MKLKLFKKEIVELYKTPRGWIIFLLTLVFSFTNAALARYTPELLSLFGDIGISMPSATFYDSYGQFYKNLFSGILIAVIILYVSLVTRERKNGSIYLILTKNISRNNFLLSKYVVANLFLTSIYTLYGVIHILITSIFFETFYTSEVILGMFACYVFSIFILNSVIAYSASYKSSGIGVLVGFFILFISPFIAQIKVIGKFTPGFLANFPIDYLYKVVESKTVIPSIIITLTLTLFIIYLSFRKFSKIEL